MTTKVIAGLGVDIEEISRFANRPYPDFTSFYQKIFSPAEITNCLAHQNPYPHFTARFCAKEAFIKAFAEQISGYPDVEVRHQAGRPVVFYQGNQYLVSLSHNRLQAMATVII